MFYMVGFFFVPNRFISRKAQGSTVLVAEELKCDVQKLRGATLQGKVDLKETETRGLEGPGELN